MTDAGLKCEAVTIFDVPQRSQIKQKRSQNKCSSPLCTKHWKIITFDHHKVPVLKIVVPPKFFSGHLVLKSVFLKEKLPDDDQKSCCFIKIYWETDKDKKLRERFHLVAQA